MHFELSSGPLAAARNRSEKVNKWYWAILALILIVGLDWYVRAPDSRSRRLTDSIESQASTQLKTYPYKFRVIRVNGGIAIMSTPRNFEVPAFKVLGVLYPDINTRNQNDPTFIAAEKLLAEVQSEARAIVLTQPGIKDVRWELDRDWLATHYIDMPRR